MTDLELIESLEILERHLARGELLDFYINGANGIDVTIELNELPFTKKEMERLDALGWCPHQPDPEKVFWFWHTNKIGCQEPEDKKLPRIEL